MDNREKRGDILGCVSVFGISAVLLTLAGVVAGSELFEVYTQAVNESLLRCLPTVTDLVNALIPSTPDLASSIPHAGLGIDPPNIAVINPVVELGNYVEVAEGICKREARGYGVSALKSTLESVLVNIQLFWGK